MQGHQLRKYFDGQPEERRVELRQSLEHYVNEGLEKYKKELQGLLRKTGTRGLMGGALANDFMALLSGVSIAGALGIRALLFTGKLFLETPALYRYMKKSRDFYGLAKYLLIKPVAYMVPFIGPIIETGSLERLAEGGVRRYALGGFFKRIGKYKSVDQRFGESTRESVGKRVNFGKKHSYAPASAMAAA